MKAQIKIEAIGDDVDHFLRSLQNLTNDLVPGLGTRTFGYKPSYWVSQIIGSDPIYKYARSFLKGKKDYAHANSKGSRGVFVYYLLESGYVYEVKRNSKRRFFCTVDDEGDIIEVDSNFVDQWIKDHSADLLKPVYDDNNANVYCLLSDGSIVHFYARDNSCDGSALISKIYKKYHVFQSCFTSGAFIAGNSRLTSEEYWFVVNNFSQFIDDATVGRTLEQARIAMIENVSKAECI